MALFLKVLPAFPLVNNELIIEAVNESENKGLFNWLVIEYIYRAFIEIVLFQILLHFRHQTKKSKVRDVSERVGISFGLILWNYIGLSVNIFGDELPYQYHNGWVLQMIFSLLYLYGNLYIYFTLLKSAIKANSRTEKKNSLYMFVQGVLFKLFIDGNLFFTCLVSDKFNFFDEEFRLFSFSGVFMRTYLLIKWNIDSIKARALSMTPLGLVILCFNIFTASFCVSSLFTAFKRWPKSSKNHRITEYFSCIKLILIWSSLLDLALFTIYIFDIPYNADNYNRLMAMNKLYFQGTLPLITIGMVSYNVSKGKSNLTISYILYGNETEKDGEDGEGVAEKEKIESDDKGGSLV